MTKRTLSVAVVTVAVVGAVPAVGSAVTTTTTKPRIDILGGSSFVPNRYLQEKTRFNKDVYALRSGATIQIRNKTPQEPHTVSVVSKSDLPKTVKGFDTCFEKGICGRLGRAHGFPEGEGPPTTPLVNSGAAGFDTKGDSIAIAPRGRGATPSVKLSAKKGKTLYFMCIIHPWMQARISVK
ncbi:MAG: hypothetical protein M3296_05090 [Actinomycetota bacterium]|nr:hypothetical protein [Actinomycetota bacterium]